MDLIRPTHVVIDLDAISENVRNLKSILSDEAMLMAVIKADAYGHGSLPVAHVALKSGAHWLGVATPEEGMALRKAGIAAPILVFGGIMEQGMRIVTEYDLRQTVFNLGGLWRLDEEARRQNKHVRVHVKVDTGMGRVGVHTDKRLVEVLSLLKQCQSLTLEGMFTHFATADEEDASFTHEQVRRFERYHRIAQNMGFAPQVLHVANSAATLAYPELHFNMVRPGIAMYGYYPSDDVKRSIELQPAMTWKTQALHIKKVPAGESVSYGRTFYTKRDSFIATLPVGYGDGYKRILSGKAKVLIKGKRAPVVGRICMDQCMIDVTDIEGVMPGDEVVLLGAQGDDCIDADEIAAWADTISYEILLSVSGRVPRVYKGGV